MSSLSKSRLLILIVWLIWGITPVASQSPIVVGGKNFTEHYLLTHMTVLVLEQAGFQVEERQNILTKHIRRQLLANDIDLYWEYTGTAYRAHLHQNDPEIVRSPEKLYQTLKRIDATYGLVWLKRANIHNAYELGVTRSTAKKYGLYRLSDLNRLLQQQTLAFGIGKSFYVRPDGFLKLVQHYQWNRNAIHVKKMSYSVVYGALNRGQVDVGMVYTTDAAIKRYDLLVLQDDLHFFPVYNPAPLLKQATAQRYPQLIPLINQLPPLLNQTTMIDLNYQVEVDGTPVETVARQWLTSVGILP